MTTKSFPLTETQKTIYIAQRLAKENTPYNSSYAFRFKSEINIELLKQAHQLILDRHGSLRIHLEQGEDGIPTQKIKTSAKFAFDEVDASDWDEPRLGHEVQGFVDQPFDLLNGPLIRVRLFIVSSTDMVMVSTFHHIVSDGWSIWIFLSELKKTYSGLSNKEDVELKPFKFDYRDFVLERKEYLESKLYHSDRAYWLDRLKDGPKLLNLPLDWPRSHKQKYLGATFRFRISNEVRDLVLSTLKNEAFSNELVSEYTFLFAAFHLLLHKYSGQSDVVVRSPVLGRDVVRNSKGEFEKEFSRYRNVYGCFISQLPYRFEYQGEKSVKDFLISFKKAITKDQQHSLYPYSHMIRDQKGGSDLSHAALSQVTFALRVFYRVRELEAMYEGETITWLGAKMQEFEINQQNSQDDLQLEMLKCKTTYACIWNYRPNLFDEKTIARLASNFESLIKNMCLNLNASVTDLDYISEKEKRDIHIASLSRVKNLYVDSHICELFLDQVERNPQKTAIIHPKGGQEISYGELNQNANRLANYLIQSGIKSGSNVGILLERSIDMIESMLAILKVDCSYVPMDRNYPEERLRLMIEDADMQLVISKSSIISSFSAPIASTVLLDKIKVETDSISDLSPACENKSTAAFTIFSSGSTGRPKGSVVTHTGVIRLAKCNPDFDVKEKDIVTQTASTSFDGASFEIWCTLLNGATLVILSKETLLSISELRASYEKYQITVSFLTTALFNKVAQLAPEIFQNLRIIKAGGDVMDLEATKKVVSACPNTKIVNGYGPSECSPFTSSYVAGPELSELHSVPIGQSLPGTKLFVLNENQQMLPLGVIGELNIGGDGVGLGYLKSNRLNKEKFTPNPFTSDQDDLYFRSGDLARFRNDGNLEYFGRIDNQVKIRGFRVEPNEIESGLGDVPGIKEKAVVVQKDQRGDNFVVAFLEVDKAADEEDFKRQVRRHLRKKLPEYMIPSSFVFMDPIPLTPNSKIDRKKLQSIKPSEESVVHTVDATNEVEERIFHLWQNLLNNPAIGIEQQFYDAGGNSIQLVELVEKIESEFNLKRLPIEDILQDPTVKGMGRLISDLSNAKVTTYPGTKKSSSSGRDNLRKLRQRSNKIRN